MPSWQSALSAAVFRQNAETVKTLRADPNSGTPSALATAEFFNPPEMAGLLRGA